MERAGYRRFYEAVNAPFRSTGFLDTDVSKHMVAHAKQDPRTNEYYTDDPERQPKQQRSNGKNTPRAHRTTSPQASSIWQTVRIARSRPHIPPPDPIDRGPPASSQQTPFQPSESNKPMAAASARAQLEERPWDNPYRRCSAIAPEVAALRALSRPAGAPPCSIDPNSSTDKTLTREGTTTSLALRAHFATALSRDRSTEADTPNQRAPPSPSPGDDARNLIDASSITNLNDCDNETTSLNGEGNTFLASRAQLDRALPDHSIETIPLDQAASPPSSGDGARILTGANGITHLTDSSLNGEGDTAFPSSRAQLDRAPADHTIETVPLDLPALLPTSRF